MTYRNKVENEIKGIRDEHHAQLRAIISTVSVEARLFDVPKAEDRQRCVPHVFTRQFTRI